MIYFDNGATTFPKPNSVVSALVRFYEECAANSGRSGHRLSAEAGEIIFEARYKLAKMMGVKNPMHVIWTFNCTDALNLAIKGVVREGWHVLTSNMEHNSTIRVLKELESKGVITLSVIDMKQLRKHVTEKTRLVVCNHVSNVNGAIMPIAEIGSFCRSKGIVTIIDAAQSGGIVPINITDCEVDMVAFAGHKSLYGVQGTGALLLSDKFDYKRLEPIRQGGTGSLSDKIVHPKFLPDCFEAGTLNIGGIAAISAGLDYINELGIENILTHERELVKYFISKANNEVVGFNVIGANEDAIGVVTFTIDGFSVSELTDILSDRFDIMSRAGLHCSPLAHQTLGSFPNGGVRFSFGVFNTKEHVNESVEALKKIVNNEL